MLACELQEELHHSAKELTERCGLDEKVLHLSGNFLSVSTHPLNSNVLSFFVNNIFCTFPMRFKLPNHGVFSRLIFSRGVTRITSNKACLLFAPIAVLHVGLCLFSLSHSPHQIGLSICIALDSVLMLTCTRIPSGWPASASERLRRRRVMAHCFAH